MGVEQSSALLNCLNCLHEPGIVFFVGSVLVHTLAEKVGVEQLADRSGELNIHCVANTGVKSELDVPIDRHNLIVDVDFGESVDTSNDSQLFTVPSEARRIFNGARGSE